MRQEINKVYNPKEVEDKIYDDWEKSGFFNPDTPRTDAEKHADRRGNFLRKSASSLRKSAFSIVMPPPNVTGTLHVGHAVMLALEDIMIRYHRMKGDDTLWLPGTDHAAIATQTKVEKILKERTGQTRHDLGKEKFLAEVENFVVESKSTIHKQIRKMGSSCDWSREAYTLDETRSRTVREVFKKMYDDGLIYRGYRIINWCPGCSSTLADDEVDYKEESGKLYYIKYNLKSGGKVAGSVTVATTRPETKLGDTAVAVNPSDKRYEKYIGKEFDVDLAGHKIYIKFIADKMIDPRFGTGAVGVTPAHSMIDWEMAEKSKLPVVQVIDEKGKMTKEAGRCAGLNIFEARKQFVTALETAGLLEKVEDYKHNVGHCYRCDSTVEQLPSKQWFVNVDKKIAGRGKSLKELAVETVKSGKIKIIPKRFEKIYFQWMKNLRDWCISRQIWFGHQIPVWYKGKEIFVGTEVPRGDGWRQDPDTLDTWFSSGLWTFSTLLSPSVIPAGDVPKGQRSPEGGDKNYEKYKNFGEWIKKSPDLKRFHPTSVMETGYDILFFWVARMILMTTYVLGEIPFKTVYLHGLVRDEKGRKMSKSLGNVIDPLIVAEKYGTDAVRLSLVLGTAAGNDLTLSEEKIAGFRNFTNKLWNIGRYVLSQKIESRKPKTETLADKWILSRLNSVIAEVTEDLENFRFSQAGEKLRSFTWDEFADWYIEISKIKKNSYQLSTINQQLLKLWHPFMPFVTEKLWEAAGGKDFLMIANWPKADKKLIDKKAEKDFAAICEIVKTIRNLRAEFKIEPAKFVKAVIYSKKDNLIKQGSEIIKRLARAESLEIKKSGEKIKGSVTVSAVAGESEIYLLLEGLVDIAKEKNRIEKELSEANKYLSSLEGKLKNKDFVSRAPKEIVAEEKLKLKEVQEKVRKLKDYLAGLTPFRSPSQKKFR
jgi:valyl-tRNA synthetase